MSALDEELLLKLTELARISGLVATHCDHAAHIEATNPDVLRHVAHRLRRLAQSIAMSAGIDLQASYANRVGQIEALSTYEVLIPAPSSEVRSARSWRDLQVAQLRHDRHYHPDVFGLSREDQLVHISIHIAKLTGAIAKLYAGSVGDNEDFYRRRLPDMMLFGIKMSTVLGERLDDSPIQTQEPSPSAASLPLP